jgi:hypothetical protein
VGSGFPNTYLTFYKGSTEEYFRVADPTAQRPDNLQPSAGTGPTDSRIKASALAKSDSSSSKAGLCKSRRPGAMARSVFKRAVKMGIKEVRKFITGRAMENP